MITLDEAAIRAGVTRLNFDYHRKHWPRNRRRSSVARTERREAELYRLKSFKLTIPKPQKRTRPSHSRAVPT